MFAKRFLTLEAPIKVSNYIFHWETAFVALKPGVKLVSQCNHQVVLRVGYFITPH